jgi:threonine 3-dehydrogenase
VKARSGVGAEWREVPVPRIEPDQVLVRVRATSICGTDVHIWNWDPWSQKRIGEKRLPQILGHEVAGEVVEVGPNVRRIQVGDYISAETHIYDPSDLTALLGCLHVGEHMKILGVDCDGAFAEYFAVPESVAWINDRSIPPELATIQEPLGNATYAVLGEDADVAGKSMLITGDGPISLFAVAVARACGVAKIFLLGLSEHNLEIGRRLGADHILRADRTTPEERLAYLREHTAGNGVDVALEMIGHPQSINDCLHAVRKAGRISAFGIGTQASIAIDYNDGIVFKGCQIHGISGRRMFDTWYRVRNLLAAGRLDVDPVITHVFLLEEFAKGFEALTALPRVAAKVVLFPSADEFQAAQDRRQAASRRS